MFNGDIFSAFAFKMRVFNKKIKNVLMDIFDDALRKRNANEQQGALLIDPQDEGWAGGPPLSPRNKALVAGSPYARCE